VAEPEKVLQIFSYMMMQLVGSRYISHLNDILSLEEGEIEFLLCDLHAHMAITSLSVHFLYASFQDFLLDPTHSGNYHIDNKVHKTMHISNCFHAFAHEHFML